MLVFNPDMFALGIAVGVLGLVMLFSLVISIAYSEFSLAILAGYLVLMVSSILAGEYLAERPAWHQNVLLVIGPALVGLWLRWLLRKRTSTTVDKGWVFALLFATVGLIGFLVLNGAGVMTASTSPGLVTGIFIVWGAVLGLAFTWRAVQVDTIGPWKWWFMLGHVCGLAIALLFLTNVLNARTTYWPVVLMLLVQLPPMYLSLVWRSRLLNELRLRSSAAGVTDPLTGLATASVFMDRLMRIIARSQHAGAVPTCNALYLIEVQNWQVLLKEFGSEFNEHLLLESAMRLRRSVNDNDMVARISSGRFAVVVQGLANIKDINDVATRLLVSGLRTDSPLVAGVELKFRIIVLDLKLSTPRSPLAARAWLDSMTSQFQSWPSSHGSRSILVIHEADGPLPKVYKDANLSQ